MGEMSERHQNMVPCDRKQETGTSWVFGLGDGGLESTSLLHEPVSCGCSSPMGQLSWPAGALGPRAGTGHWSGAEDSSGKSALERLCDQKSQVGGRLANCVSNICPVRGDSYFQGLPGEGLTDSVGPDSSHVTGGGGTFWPLLQRSCPFEQKS